VRGCWIEMDGQHWFGPKLAQVGVKSAALGLCCINLRAIGW
jgi:hypothetical protein